MLDEITSLKEGYPFSVVVDLDGPFDTPQTLIITADVNFNGTIEPEERYELEIEGAGENYGASSQWVAADDGEWPGNGTSNDPIEIKVYFAGLTETESLEVHNVAPSILTRPTLAFTTDSNGDSIAQLSVYFADLGIHDEFTGTVTWGDGSTSNAGNESVDDDVTCYHLYGHVLTVSRNVAPGDQLLPLEVTIADDDNGEGNYRMLDLDVALNNDDDNGSETADMFELAVTNEDDIKALDLTSLIINGMDPTEGIFVLSYDTGVIRIWDSVEKNNLIMPYGDSAGGPSGMEDAPTIPYTGQTNVFVEGFAANTTSITVSWIHEDYIDFWSPIPCDNYFLAMESSLVAGGSVDVSVWAVDIDTDSDNSGVLDRNATEDIIEEDAPGKFLLLNSDDDNANGVPDRFDRFFFGGAIDDDLEEVALDFSVLPSIAIGYRLELRGMSSSVIDVWGSRSKHIVSNTFTIGVDPIPSSVFIEGVAIGSAALSWTLNDPQGQIVLRDRVLFTVLSGDLQAHRQRAPVFQDYVIPAGLEDNQTIGIRRNGDDDDGDLLPDGFKSPIAGEDDTMQLDAVTLEGGPGVQWIITRSNVFVSVWSDVNKTTAILGTAGLVGNPSGTNIGNSAVIPGGSTLWIEWPHASGGTSTISLVARAANTDNGDVIVDTVTYEPFNNVTVVWMGEFQTPVVPAQPGMGLMQWAIDQYEFGYNVYVFEEADWWWEDVLAPGYNEIKNAVNFQGVSDVALVGYSHGGGTVWEAANKLTNESGPGITNPFSISFTGFIDAVSQSGRWGLGIPGTLGSVNTRPPGSIYHVSQFQKNTSIGGLWLNGDYSGADDDLDRSPLGVNHSTIDDSAVVLDFLDLRYRQKVVK